MIRKVIPKSEENPYRRFFFEADDDTTNIKVRSNNRTNYSDDVEDDSNENQDNGDGVESTNIKPKTSGYNYSNDVEDDNQDDTQNNDDNQGDNTEDQNTDDGNQNNDENNQDDNNQDNEEDNQNNETDSQGDQDYTNDVEDNNQDNGDNNQNNDENNGDENNQDNNNDDNQDDNEESEDSEQEETRRKYNLYRDFLLLYDSIGSYITKLEKLSCDSLEGSAVFGSITTRLNTIRQSLYEYMIIKYDSVSYVQALYFMQTVIAAVKVCFDLIRNNVPYIKQQIKVTNDRK